MPDLYDTHAHLDFPDFREEADEVVQRAAAAGIARIVTIGTEFESSRRAIGLAKRFATRDTARWLDQETGLKERLSTAVELTETEAKGSEWSALVIRDAAKAADDVVTGRPGQRIA